VNHFLLSLVPGIYFPGFIESGKMKSIICTPVLVWVHYSLSAQSILLESAISYTTHYSPTATSTGQFNSESRTDLSAGTLNVIKGVTDIQHTNQKAGLLLRQLNQQKWSFSYRTKLKSSRIWSGKEANSTTLIPRFLSVGKGMNRVMLLSGQIFKAATLFMCNESMRKAPDNLAISGSKNIVFHVCGGMDQRFKALLHAYYSLA